jgi:hypothetical protein
MSAAICGAKKHEIPDITLLILAKLAEQRSNLTTTVSHAT